MLKLVVRLYILIVCFQFSAQASIFDSKATKIQKAQAKLKKVEQQHSVNKQTHQTATDSYKENSKFVNDMKKGGLGNDHSVKATEESLVQAGKNLHKTGEAVRQSHDKVVKAQQKLQKLTGSSSAAPVETR